MKAYLIVAALAFPCVALADDITSNHPEDAIPDTLPRLTAPGPFSGMVSDVQRKLHGFGFDAGPVNGDFGTKTQAALAQFQIANGIPASGMMDAETLRALDVPLVDQAIAPGAAEPQASQGLPQASEGSSQPEERP
ncbi:MAG: peptidoglycan-binding domain-containing protein [Clostridia bacterium]